MKITDILELQWGFQNKKTIMEITFSLFQIQLKSRLRLENIKLTVHVQWPLAANLTNFNISAVGKSSCY